MYDTLNVKLMNYKIIPFVKTIPLKDSDIFFQNKYGHENMSV